MVIYQIIVKNWNYANIKKIHSSSKYMDHIAQFWYDSRIYNIKVFAYLVSKQRRTLIIQRHKF